MGQQSNSRFLRFFYIALGFLFLLVGFVGIFLPLLPTTPFVLLAAFFFSLGSEKFHRWLLQNKHFGPMIREWNEHGRIRRKAKKLATLAMAIALLPPLKISSGVWIDVGFSEGGWRSWIFPIAATVSLGVLTFIWSRPDETSS